MNTGYNNSTKETSININKIKIKIKKGERLSEAGGGCGGGGWGECGEEEQEKEGTKTNLWTSHKQTLDATRKITVSVSFHVASQPTDHHPRHPLQKQLFSSFLNLVPLRQYR